MLSSFSPSEETERIFGFKVESLRLEQIQISGDFSDCDSDQIIVASYFPLWSFSPRFYTENRDNQTSSLFIQT